ncbi:MAG: Ig-like domain-containing protein, partial [Clostridium sp.]|nr:Ig-like domain-containing protein [Clostridium sp.]
MHNSISKKLLAGALSVMMVLSLVAPTNAQAASSYSFKQKSGLSKVYSGSSYTYYVKGVKSSQYIKVAKTYSATTVKKGSTTLKKTTKVKGTGKTITLKVVNPAKNEVYKNKLTVKIYSKKSNKLVKTLTRTATVYAKTTDLTLDKTEASLKPGETVTLTATKAPANTKSVTWKSSNTAVATVKDGVVTAVAAGTTTITATAGNKSTTATITVVGDLSITAKQTGAAKIEVTANRVLTADDTITVTRGTTTQKFASELSTDGKTATITLETAITASDYTVKVTPKDTEAKVAEATFTGVKAVLSSIKFASDKLVLLTNAGTSASVVVNGYNQFDEKVAMSTSNTKFYVTGGTATSYTSDTGVLVVAPTSSAYPFTVNGTVAVTVLYNDGTTVLQQAATLTISAAAYIKSLTFGDLATTDSDLAKEHVT